MRVARNLEWKRLLNSCWLTVCKYPPVGNSLILIIVQKSRHFKLLIGVSYQRMFNWKLTRREPDLYKWHCAFNHPGVWERKEGGKNKRHNGEKGSLISPSDWGFAACGWCYFTTMETGLGFIHSSLSLVYVGFFSLRNVDSNQAESSKLQEAPGCNASFLPLLWWKLVQVQMWSPDTFHWEQPWHGSAQIN